MNAADLKNSTLRHLQKIHGLSLMEAFQAMKQDQTTLSRLLSGEAPEQVADDLAARFSGTH